MEHNFSKTITKSGATLWTLSSSNYNSVSVGVLVKCGTRDEILPKEAGIAHALEHMHFQGTESFPNNLQLSEYIEEVGGEINAWTSDEKTFYFARVPVGYADRGVRIISEQMNKSIFPGDKIPIEMKNIVQEINRRNDNPNSYLGQLESEFMYKDHPLSKDTLGSKESVLAFGRNDFLNFKQRYYNSANYTFIAIGNIAELEALELFDKYFTEPPNTITNIRKEEKAPIQTEKQFIKRKELDQLHVSLGTLLGASEDKSSLYLEFFSKMISGGMSFPLFQEVRDKRGLCYSIGSSVNKRSDFGSFHIHIGTDPKKYKEAIGATLEVIEKSKIDENLLNKVKNLSIGKLLLAYEHTGSIISKAERDITCLGYPRGFEETKKEIEEVSISNIKQAVDEYLKPKQILTVLLAPKDFVAD